MRKWLLIAFVPVIVLAVVVWWEGKACQAAADQCATANSSNPQQNDSLTTGRKDSTGEQPKARIETDARCYRSNSYLCRIVTPANLPNILLVLIGMGGIIVAIGTLDILERQTAATKESAEAARDSVRLQEIIQKRWVRVDGWRHHGGVLPDENLPRLSIAADISNPTSVPFTVLGVNMKVGVQTLALTSGNVPAPKAPPIIAEFPVTLNAEQIHRYQTGKLVLVVTGEVIYVDAFQNHKTQPFGQVCVFELNQPFRAVPFHQM